MKLKTKFQDEDFELNETANVDIATMSDGRIKAQAVAKSGGVHTFFYDDLKTFANDWEDYEERFGYWYIDFDGDVFGSSEPFDSEKDEEKRRKIGNHFNTREEAEKAVEKLKAWKRLKDAGVVFELATLSDDTTATIFARKQGNIHDYDEELFLLFGGEE